MPEVRQARLRGEFADLYPGVPAEQWLPAQAMMDMVAASRLRAGRPSGEILRSRLLDHRHFDFRGGYTRPHPRHTRLMDFES